MQKKVAHDFRYDPRISNTGRLSIRFLKLSRWLKSVNILTLTAALGGSNQPTFQEPTPSPSSQLQKCQLVWTIWRSCQREILLQFYSVAALSDIHKLIPTFIACWLTVCQVHDDMLHVFFSVIFGDSDPSFFFYYCDSDFTIFPVSRCIFCLS